MHNGSLCQDSKDLLFHGHLVDALSVPAEMPPFDQCDRSMACRIKQTANNPADFLIGLTLRDRAGLVGLWGMSASDCMRRKNTFWMPLRARGVPARL